MKKIRYIIRMLPVLACALALASCDNDEYTATGSGGTPLEFRAVIGDTHEARTRSTVDNSFMEDDMISIDLNSTEEPKYYKYHNGKFIAADSDNAWYADETPTVKAIYPAEKYFSILMGNSVNYEVSADQTGDNYKDADVLYACDISFEPQNDTLQFQHVMAKIVINIRQGGYTGDANISGVTLSGLYRQTTLALNGLNFEVQGQSGNNVDIQAHKSASPASGMVATFEALVIPGQTISQGTQFATIEVNDKDFAYTLDKGITFAQGTRHTFNLILTSEQAVTVSGIEVGDWDNGGTHTL